jgi:signal transduction histidine kinase
MFISPRDMKLNGKTIRNYLLYSSALFLLTIPVFYFVVRSVLLNAVDGSLHAQFRETRENAGAIHSSDELTAWAKMDNDVSIEPIDHETHEHVSTVERFNRRHGEAEPYREYSGTIMVAGRLYELTIRSSLVENEDLLGSILVVQTTALFILVLSLLWINQGMSKRLWQPFYVALRTMRDYRVNERTDPFFIRSTTDEFNELNTAIEQLFNRSHQVFLQQREFTENAAHEMQTPVAIFQSKLELLMQTSPLNREQAELINTLDSTVRRLTKLNQTLLLLAKIENNQYTDLEKINIREACEKMIEHLSVLTEEKGISVHVNFPVELYVYANPVLIDILIGNLLANAIRYNCNDGEIFVSTTQSELVISNSGTEIPLSAERIFSRFHKQTRRETNVESTGLGLAIVKNICTLYHFEVSYNFIKNRHSFSVCFNTLLQEMPVSSRIAV